MQIFIKINGVTNGPFLIERVKQMLFNGQVTPTDQAFIDGQTTWIPLSQVPGLQDASSSSKPNQGPQRGVSFLLGAGIFFLPFVFSWFTLQRGYSTLAKVIAFSWLGLMLVSLGIQPLPRGGGNRESSFSIQPVVTLSKYQQLQNGMLYQQVVQIIGNSGEEASRNHMDGVPGVMESIDTVLYQWVNPGGSNMNAMFQNDKLISKAQYGLR